MNTNAPEKIYVVIDPIWGSMSVNYNRNDAENIEYARADAFIEKALKWIDNTFHGASIDSSCGELVDVVMSKESVYKDDLIEDFKNYMKEG